MNKFLKIYWKITKEKKPILIIVLLFIKVSDYIRGARVSLDISAGSPVIFLPMSGRSHYLIVAELGSLTVKNKFMWSGSPETISRVSLKKWNKYHCLFFINYFC